MAGETKKTPDTQIDGSISSQPSFGAYSAETGSSFSRDIPRKVPYALLDKTGRTDESPASKVMDANNRWLKELGITSTDPVDFNKAWQTDNFKQKASNHEWRDSYGGKLAIRTFSRGIMGSVFFAAGQHIATKSLENYSFDILDPSKNSTLTNPLTYVARLFDKTLGAGIYKAALTVNGGDHEKAKNVVTFRHTNAWKGYHGEKGRSYGHEGLAITFDFGLASLGDYFGREIAGLLDPNTEKKWMKEGHMDVPQATKALLKSVWLGTSKAMGEDYFAMAAGYPYVVRGTRNLIDKFSPGFKYDSDRWGNGGSVKIDDNKNIVGNYQLEGMTDLGLRFSAYNVYTKMFRDGYDKAAYKIKHMWDNDRTVQKPESDAPPTPTNLLKSAVDKVKTGINYVVRTTVKMGIIMIPSSTVFAFIRSAQSKDIGLAIHPEHGPVGVKIKQPDGTEQWAPVAASGAVKSRRSEFPLQHDTAYTYYDGKAANFNPFIGDKSSGYEKRYKEFGQNVEWHDKFTNPVGRFCNDSGHALTEVAKPVARFFKKDANFGNISKHAQRYMDGTLAYTPYFMVKTDLLSTAYDTPRMDMAIDRMIGGIGHLKFGEFKAGAGEVLHSIMMRPFDDVNREKLAQKKMRTYSNQLWSSQDEIIAKEREEEFHERMDAMLTLGKPVSMKELYQPSFADRVGKRRGLEGAANDSFYSQNITPMVQRKPEDYKKPEQQQQEWKKQANSSWRDRTIQEFQSNTSPDGHSIN